MRTIAGFAALAMVCAACTPPKKRETGPAEPPARVDARTRARRPGGSGSVLARSDTPPPGVSRKLNALGVSGFGMYGCPAASRSSSGPVPTLYVFPRKIKILDSVVVCVLGLPGGEANVDKVTIELRGASGVVRRRKMPVKDGSARWDFRFLPAGPPGTYAVNVLPAGLKLSSSIAVSPVSRSRMVVSPEKGRAGDVFVVAFAGFPPDRLVKLRVYRCRARQCVYATTVSVRSNRRGSAVYRLKSGAGDAAGRYTLVTDPQGQTAWFTLGGK